MHLSWKLRFLYYRNRTSATSQTKTFQVQLGNQRKDGRSSKVFDFLVPAPNPRVYFSSVPTITLPLDEMTVEEKLHLMETIWAIIAARPDELESPAWHGEVLRERQR